MIPFALSIIAGLGIAILGARDRLWAVAAILFLLPTYLVRFELFNLVPMTMLETMVLMLFAVFLIQEWRNFKWPAKFQWFHYLITLILVAGVFGLLVTPDLRAGAGLFKAFIVEPILFFIVFINTIKTQRELRVCIWALGLSALAVSLVTAVQYATGWGIPDPWHAVEGRRATAFYGYPNAVGLYVAPILTLFIAVMLHVKFFTRRNVLFIISVIMFMVLALLTARVEGAIVAVAAGVLVAFLFTTWRWVALGVAVLGLAGAFLYEPVREVLLFQDVSGDVRLALWEGTKNLLVAQPIFGAGLGAFPMAYDIYRLDSHVELLQYPHNILLNFWVELGILGVLWIVAAIATVVVKSVWALRFSEGYGVVLLAVFTTVVVYGIVDVPFFKNDLSILFWVWLGFLAAISQESVFIGNTQMKLFK